MSIEWAMWFALGVLSAGVLALLVTAAVWRRAVRLTARRVRATMPDGVEAVRAEADLEKARFARDGRRFELALADLRRRNAEERLAVGRGRAEVDRLGTALTAEQAARGAAEATIATLTDTLAGRDARVSELEAELAAEQARAAGFAATIGARDEEIARLVEGHRRAVADTVEGHRGAVAGLMAEHADAAEALRGEIADRVAEIEARKTTIASLEAQVRSLKLQLAEASTQREEARRARGLAETASAQEKDRADRLDRRIARLVADVADREERVERLGRELERSRQAMVFANARASVATAAGGEAPAGVGDNLLASLEQLERRNRELEDRLAAIVRARPEAVLAPGATTREDLRRSLADLAAEIVHLSALAEGPNSPIARIVAAAEPSAGGLSLAERIRALRARPSAAEGAGAADDGGV
jgi:chromosome segregation ATPase